MASRFPAANHPRARGMWPESFANADTAERLLGWKAELPIEQGIADSLKWGELRKSILNFD